MSSIKKNFAYSTVLTAAGYLFPLITYPYVSRVLGVEGLGYCQYADSIVSYFNIMAMMGIATIGIREIAKSKGTREEMSIVFSSLLTLNFITAFVAIAALFILIPIIEPFASHSRLLYIGTARILCGVLLVEWLYKGLENFRYITLRSLVVRCIYVVAVFAFVRESDDYDIYFFLTVITTIINAIINILYSRNFVDYSFKKIDLTPYIRPFFIYGFYKILTAMYTSFNVMYLGSHCGDIEVGYYSTSTKLYFIIMSVFTAFTGVMMPRMSSLVAEGKEFEFRKMTAKSIDFLLVFCVPIIILSEVYAPQIIRLISGEGYEGAIVPMRIVMPLMLVIGYEQIIIIQMLSPLRKDSAILKNSCFGALVALCLNIFVVPKLGSIGSAIVWCGSEFAVLCSAQYFVNKYICYKMPIKKMLLGIVVFLPALIIIFLLNKNISNWLVSLVVGITFMCVYFVLVEIVLLKNPIVLNNIQVVKNKICNRKSQLH